MNAYFKEFIPKSWIALKNYDFSTFRKDLIAGLTVGIVSVPLAMAFAISSGVDPERGLYTAIIAGFLISLLGGSRVQIGGPTGAFVVIIYGVVQRQGYEGLVFATLIAAVLLIIMGLCRLGTMIKYIPYPLVTGFTSGIAVLIFSQQIKDFFGLKIQNVPMDFIPKWISYFKAFSTFDPLTFYVAGSTLLLIILIRKFFPVIPWGIGSIALATGVCTYFALPVETIASHFGELTSSLPRFHIPHFSVSFENLHVLIPDALTIAFLAAVESLLSATLADGMIGGKHKSNAELIAQGIGNLGSVIFGGIPATGALARTATNVKTGAKTPVAGMIHALTILLVILFFAPLVSNIPLPALSAVLIMIAWNMSEIDHFRHLFKAPIGDVAVLLTSFFLTIFVDLTVAVGVGMVMAAFLFMKRMSSLSNVLSISFLFKEKIEEYPEKNDPDAISKKEVPPHVDVYEINGPFFFGVADSLKDVLNNMERPPKVFILRMRKVPVIDASGLHALDEFFMKCQRQKTTLVLSGVKADVLKSLKKFGLAQHIGENNIHKHIDAALKHANELVKLT